MSSNSSIKKKTYFLCPLSEHFSPPPAGPLHLGSIICSVSEPQLSLNKSNIVPIANLNPLTVETNWMKTITEDKKPRSDRRDTFLQLAKRGSGMYAKHTSREKVIFECGTVTTISFEPTPQYVAEAMKIPAVKAWLREPKQRLAPIVSLYLVTGMKLAKSAKVKYSISVNTTIKAHIRTSTGRSLTGLITGAKGCYIRTYDDEMESEQDAEFAFAFRVKRLSFRYGRDVKIEEFTEGACLRDAEDDNGCEMESVSLDGADGSNAGNVSDDADVGTDADGDDVENIENGFSTENNAAGTSTHHDTDPPRITAAKLISNLAKNRTLAFKIIENVLGQTNR
jgi:hypothetical protein